MDDLTYTVGAGPIAALLLVSMVIVMEIGFRFGQRRKAVMAESVKSHINVIQSSILGILALLLGFTFSLSLQRYDTRSKVVVEEANAISTAYLRADLLPPALRSEARATLREYLDVRVAASIRAPRGEDREARMEVLIAKAVALQTTLWAHARKAIEMNPNPATSGLFVQSINEVIDSFGTRDAELNRHVPELVLMLLHATFLMAAAIVGIACGVGGHRPSLTSYLMLVLIVVLVFIILDLDRPRRGLIAVSQKSLVNLQSTIRTETGGPPSAGAAK
jgi:hypothetical protein